MKLSMKLSLSFGVLVAFSIGLGCFAIFELSRIQSDVSELGVNRLPSIEAIAKLNDSASRFRRAELLHVASLEQDDMKKFESTLDKAENDFSNAKSRYEQLISSDEERTVYDNFLQIWSRYRQLHETVIQHSRKNENDKASAITTREQNDIFAAIQADLDRLIKINDEGGAKSSAAAEATYVSARSSLIAAMVGTALLGLLLTYFLMRNVLGLLGEDPATLAAIAQRIAEGDLNVRFDEKQNTAGVFGAIRNMAQTIRNRVGFSEGVLQGISTPCVVVDPNEKLIFLNQQIIDYIERSGTPQDFTGSSAAKFFYNDESRKTVTGMSIAQKQVIKKANVEVSSMTGQKRTCNIDSAPIYDLDGKVIAGITLLTDLTEVVAQQRHAEAATARGILQAAERIESVVDVITSASEELSAQVEQSSKGAEEQAGLVGETATSMEEMNATVLEVAKNASTAARTAEQAKKTAEDGASVVERAIAGIDEVRRLALGLKDDMTSLGQEAEGIGNIMNVISDIADQTNLLALNAAIEAARAGDAGRGFAVVADEVRKLAEKTMSATKEVGLAISAVQTGTRKNIDNVERAASKVEEATTLASKSGEALREIVALVDTTTDQAHAIATASEEQAASSEEISRAIENVNRISTETSHAMRQSAQAVAEMANQAQTLQALILEMKSQEKTES